MVQSNKVTTIIERIKWHTGRLSDQERELLRDELLTMLIIKDINGVRNTSTTSNDSFSELSKEEKSLIKKLADQTEQLSKLSRKDQDPNS